MRSSLGVTYARMGSPFRRETEFQEFIRDHKSTELRHGWKWHIPGAPA